MSKRKIMLNILTVLFVLFTFAQVGHADGNDDGMVRLLHASPDAPEVNISVNGDTVVEGLDFKTATDYLYLAPGEYTVEIFPTEDDSEPVLTTTLAIESSQAYTVAAVNQLENLDVKVIKDKTTTEEGMTSVRVGHLSPDAPSVDVLANGNVVFSDASYLDVTDYEDLSPGTVDLDVNVSGSDDTVLSLEQTELEANTLYSVFAVGLAEGEPSLDAVVLADPSMERIPDEMPATGMGGTQNYKEDSTILGGFLMIFIALTSVFLLFRQQPWNKQS
ncbi:DUF4397 domain-containing protein [Salipaludibacillus daqingensis]|uniref:DUF4397 domain-containing protein n=1 Tax=Salipaludibacillus daqingensis TaxID=3041001 RepID=UPI002476EB1B|nr:DUF4397 domain-containing protein [Salipaludibacillus daqingensis]